VHGTPGHCGARCRSRRSGGIAGSSPGNSGEDQDREAGMGPNCPASVGMAWHRPPRELRADLHRGPRSGAARLPGIKGYRVPPLKYWPVSSQVGQSRRTVTSQLASGRPCRVHIPSVPIAADECVGSARQPATIILLEAAAHR